MYYVIYLQALNQPTPSFNKINVEAGTSVELTTFGRNYDGHSKCSGCSSRSSEEAPGGVKGFFKRRKFFSREKN